MINETQVTNAYDKNDKRVEIFTEDDYENKIESIEVRPHQAFGIMNEIINKNVEFMDSETVVFISGCNLVCYNIETKTSKFLIRKCPELAITSMSVGYKTYKKDETNNNELLLDPYICLGEYNSKTKTSQVSTISYRNPEIQHVLTTPRKNKENLFTKEKLDKEEYNYLDWKVTFATVLNNSPYCLAISRKANQSKLSFWKYTQEKFVSEVLLEEHLYYCAYNPQNPLELVLCGKGYLRLWNVFINESSLKEHPQRFLRAKQEKEHSFLKAEFFDNKSFMFIVGTQENLFYIIEGFQVIYDFNASYTQENIADMNIHHIVKTKEDEDDNEDDELTQQEEGKYKHKSKTSKIFSQSNSLMNKVTNQLIDDSIDINNQSKSNSTKSKKGKETKEDKFTKPVYEANPLKTFFLLNNSLILIGFQHGSITYIYKLEKDFKNKKQKELMNLVNKEDEKKNNSDDCKILRLAKNIRSIINIIVNPAKSQAIFVLEVSNNEDNVYHPNSLTNIHNSKNDYFANSICLYLFSRISSKLIFDREIFKEYFYFDSIKSLDLDEKKKVLLTITTNNWLRCFDYNTYNFSIKHYFKSNEHPHLIVSSPNNNLFGVCFNKKFVIYALFKEKIKIFCEFEINNPYATFTENGDYIALSGESQVNKNYCIYFIDTFYFNTVFVIENIPHSIKKIQFKNNDKFIFALLENYFILGWALRFDLLTVNMMIRLKEFDKLVDNYVFKLFFRHTIKDVEYADFDYDSFNDLLIVIDKSTTIYKLSIYNKFGRNLIANIESKTSPKIIKIISDLSCLVVGTEIGSLQIYKWPFEINTNNNFIPNIINMPNTEGSQNINNNKILNANDFLMYEINIHTRDLNNIILTQNLKHIITTSVDGSIILSNILIKKRQTGYYDDFVEFNYFRNTYGEALKPNVEDIIKLYDIYEFRISDIRKKDNKVEQLEKNIKTIQHNMSEQKDMVITEHKSEIFNLDAQRDEALGEEIKKQNTLQKELDDLRSNVESELENRILEHEKEKERLTLKYREKLQLYKNEIERLNKELRELQENIEQKFNSVIEDQSDNFSQIFTNYSSRYTALKEKIEENLKMLVKYSAEFDEAVDSNISDYERLIKEMDNKILDNIAKNKEEVGKLLENLEKEKMSENAHKASLDMKVQESDKIIQKNAEIKKNIIETTQRTITFQEQLLETDKNLIKIDKKIQDLIVKNKHLEQIRFVLEHRMTSLEKEKAPLEGQCNFLEKQKNNLQEEFNKLILQINLKNQALENKQSQLKASLIQNFEVEDQKQYLNKKLIHLQNEIKAFILDFNGKGPGNGQFHYQENKATSVALKLRQFYDKYFSNNIDEELQNYHYYLQKLQEESEKTSIANNFDLIMRDKGEEKLIAEKEKLKHIKSLKEKGFRRMQNENTILIAECNRLRKNLHEIYMHVVDIEQKFEDLTKINPTLNKTEIVYQIKEFIKQTHNKIKSNFKEGEEEQINNLANNNNNSPFSNQGLGNINIQTDENNNFGKDVIKSIDEQNEKILYQNKSLDILKVISYKTKFFIL